MSLDSLCNFIRVWMSTNWRNCATKIFTAFFSDDHWKHETCRRVQLDDSIRNYFAWLFVIGLKTQQLLPHHCLKGLFTNFERNIFHKRSISIKRIWLEIIEKIGCSESVQPSTVIYIINITRTDFEHHFSKIFRVRFVLSRWTFYKNVFFSLRHEKNVICSILVNNHFKQRIHYYRSLDFAFFLLNWSEI